MFEGFLFGAPEWIRTTDLQFRKLLLYPTELRKQRYNNTKKKLEKQDIQKDHPKGWSFFGAPEWNRTTYT